MTLLNRNVGPHTARYAVLGEHLGHTWSPYIHNSLFAAGGRDAIYLPITVPSKMLSSAVDVFKCCFGGFNITIPYKEQIIPFLDDLSDSARACGAVNTVVCKDGRLVGHNTDGEGMLRALEENGVKTTEVNALILGGGGAARAVAYALLMRGGHITFAVRDILKCRKVVDELAASLTDGAQRLHVCALDSISGTYDVLIHCTPVGMMPNEFGCPVGKEVVECCGAVFDAVYNPRKTRLLALAQHLGKPAIEGLGMLYYQAVEAQRLWFGSTGVTTAVERSIYEALSEQL